MLRPKNRRCRTRWPRGWSPFGERPARPRRNGQVGRTEDKAGVQTPTVHLDFGGSVLHTDPPMYIDGNTGEVGLLDCNVPASVVVDHLRAPALAPEHVEAVQRRMALLNA